MKKIIFFELNEVPFRVMDEFCDRNPDSTFAKIRPQCHEYKTYAKDTGTLEPWVTWPSVHRGVSNQSHQIHDYNQPLDDVDHHYPPVWKILKQKGIKTGVFASLHSSPLPSNFADYDFYVPDPFASESVCHPPAISDFQAFNLAMSRISGKNVSSKLLLGPASKVFLGAGKLGLRPATFVDVGRQITHEFLNPKVVGRRRIYQSVLAFDVFMKLLRRQKPEFATFFSNHVASAMHRYWAATFPSDYEENTVDPQWQESYKNEINFAMQKFDRFLSRLLRFVDRNQDYQIVILGSMGQQATETPNYASSIVKIVDTAALLNQMGLEDGEWQVKAAMVPQVNLVIAESKKEHFRIALNSFSIDGQTLSYREDEGGFFSLDFMFPDVQVSHAKLLDQTIAFQDLGLDNETLQDGVRASGWHTPEGAMLIYNPQAKAIRKNQKTSTLSICPTILENYGIPVPDYMSSERVEVLSA